LGVGLEAQSFQGLERLPLGRRLLAVQGQGVEEDIEPPSGDLAGVEQADRAGRGVAGVGEERQSRFLALAVEFSKGGEGHVDFPPGLDCPPVLDRQGQAADGAGVGGDVISPDAVPAGHGPLEPAAPVEEGHAQAVDLELGHVRDLRPGQEFPGPLLEVPQILLAVAVVEAEHGAPVGDLDEALQRLLAHSPGGGLGDGEVGEIRLQPPQLGHQAVELGVGDLRVVVDVVLFFVVFDLPAELEDGRRRFLTGRGHAPDSLRGRDGPRRAHRRRADAILERA
jgi:hypothetical protein